MSDKADKDKDKNQVVGVVGGGDDVVANVETAKAEQQPKEKLRSDITSKEMDYAAYVKADSFIDTHWTLNIIIYFVALFIIIFLIWAHFAILDEMTVGDGKVIPSSHVQVIQNLEGGIVDKLDVREGQIVDKNQVLMVLDETRFASSYREKEAHYLTLQANIARLKAQAEGKSELILPKALADHPELAENEQILFKRNTSALAAEIKKLKKDHDLAKKEHGIIAPLVAEGLMSKIDLIRLEREINESQDKMREKTDAFRGESQMELNEKKAELTSLTEALKGLRDRMERTTIRSPVHGIVNSIHVTTVGGVIKPGMDILEIVPIEENLLIEAKIRPADIAFLRPGQKATVKVTAYDFAIYGGLNAVVTSISPDTVTDEKDNSFYKVILKTSKNFLGSKAKPLPIIPGMTISAHILTGHKSVLAYLLKPLLRAKELALRER